jgi:hypothetical protein
MTISPKDISFFSSLYLWNYIFLSLFSKLAHWVLSGEIGLPYRKIFYYIVKYKNKVLNCGVFHQFGENKAIDKLNLIPKNDQFNVCCLQLKVFPMYRNKIS